MRDLYSASFDFARLGYGAPTAINAAVLGGGTLTGNLGFLSGMYMHGNVGMTGSATIDGQALGALAAGLQALVGGGAMTVVLSQSTLRYTMASASSFSVTWNGALGTALRDILGFDANLSGTTTYSSTKRPKYLICSRVAGQSQVHETYEQSGRIAYAEADDGSAYSTCPDSIATYRDWVQAFETATGPTDAEYAGSSSIGGAPMRITDVGSATKIAWSWQDFVRHVRAAQPFALVDRSTSVKGEGSIYKMRGDGAHFDPTRVTADFDGHWSVPMRCRYIGASVAV